MENTLAASYCGLVVGALLRHNKQLADDWSKQIESPNHKTGFEPMLTCLNKMLAFMKLTVCLIEFYSIISCCMTDELNFFTESFFSDNV